MAEHRPPRPSCDPDHDEPGRVCTCGALLDWQSLRQVGTWEIDEARALELRNCSDCNTTISRFV